MLMRMLRAAALSPALYEEVEKDKSLDREAVRVVAIVAIADGIGLALYRMMRTGDLDLLRALVWLAFGVIGGVFVYYVWAWVTQRVGGALYGARSGIGQVRRTLGYAQTPRALAFFWFVPAVGPALGAIGWLWALVAGIVAIRQALDFSSGRAIVTVVVGWVVALVIFWLLAFLVGIPFFMVAGLEI